ncbi:hypothetical protein DV736_g6165, partial [Chaetothyriales sp. CBS 134916]
MNRGARPGAAAAGRQPNQDQYGQSQPQAQDDQYGQNQHQTQDDQYGEIQSQAQDDQYVQNQSQDDYDQQDGKYGLDGQDDPNALHQQGDDQGIDENVNQQQDEYQQGKDDKEGHNSGYYDPSKKSKGSKAITKKGTGKLGKKGQYTPKPEHAHSRFSQDPHHHGMMGAFHKVAREPFPNCTPRNIKMLTLPKEEGLTPAHIESFVHIGTFALAHLAKQSGMTAGHEPSDDEEDE